MKKTIYIIAALVVSLQLCLVSTVSAKLYTWVDRYGVTRRTYYPPPDNQVMKQQEPSQAATSRQAEENQVELFVTSWCPYCKKAIAYFKSKGIQIRVYDIEKDPDAAMRKRNLDNGGGVPFAIINGRHVSGYAPEQYAKALR